MEQARQERPRKGVDRPRKKTPTPVVIATGRVSYVDEYGEAIPDFTAEATLPVWMALGFVLERADLEGFTQEESAQLAAASAPVAQKWAGVFLPYAAELALGGLLIAIMWGKVSRKEERRRERLATQNVRVSATPPGAPPHGKTVP